MDDDGEGIYSGAVRSEPFRTGRFALWSRRSGSAGTGRSARHVLQLLFDQPSTRESCSTAIYLGAIKRSHHSLRQLCSQHEPAGTSWGTPGNDDLLLISYRAVARHRWAYRGTRRRVSTRRSSPHICVDDAGDRWREPGDHMSEARCITHLHVHPALLPGRRAARAECALFPALGQSHGHRGELSKPRLLVLSSPTGRAVCFDRSRDNAQAMASGNVDRAGRGHCLCRRVAFDRLSHELYCATNFLTTHGER